MTVRACLLDVYETAISCDFGRHASEMPALAGISPEAWNAGFFRYGDRLNDGTLTIADAYAMTLRDCGAPADGGLVELLTNRDRELLLEVARVHDDTWPLLDALRDRDIPVALVSNCAENTRTLLVHLGLAAAVDDLVLSCEVGVSKPSPGIYRHALERLGVEPSEALMVDDQAAYCAGAAAVGVRAAHVVRAPGVAPTAGEGVTLVRDLTEVVGLL